MTTREEAIPEKWHDSWAEFPTVFDYEGLLREAGRVRQRAEAGGILLKAKAHGWNVTRQGKLRPLAEQPVPEKAQFWMRIFNHEIKERSGRHTHQGGLAIFIVDGKGYSMMDGTRYDWEKGDLLLLPIKPGGVEHQHFNQDPEKPSRWLAIVPSWIWELIGRTLEQKAVYSEFKEDK